MGLPMLRDLGQWSLPDLVVFAYQLVEYAEREEVCCDDTLQLAVHFAKELAFGVIEAKTWLRDQEV